MKTQCPKCKNEQDVPKEYEGKNVKCLSCKTPFFNITAIHLSSFIMTDVISLARLTARKFDVRDKEIDILRQSGLVTVQEFELAVSPEA